MCLGAEDYSRWGTAGGVTKYEEEVLALRARSHAALRQCRFTSSNRCGFSSGPVIPSV